MLHFLFLIFTYMHIMAQNTLKKQNFALMQKFTKSTIF